MLYEKMNAIEWSNLQWIIYSGVGEKCFDHLFMAYTWWKKTQKNICKIQLSIMASLLQRITVSMTQTSYDVGPSQRHCVLLSINPWLIVWHIAFKFAPTHSKVDLVSNKKTNWMWCMGERIDWKLIFNLITRAPVSGDDFSQAAVSL